MDRGERATGRGAEARPRARCIDENRAVPEAIGQVRQRVRTTEAFEDLQAPLAVTGDDGLAIEARGGAGTQVQRRQLELSRERARGVDLKDTRGSRDTETGLVVRHVIIFG